MDHKVWTQRSGWGEIPKIYPTMQRARQAITFHSMNTKHFITIDEYNVSYKESHDQGI